MLTLDNLRKLASKVGQLTPLALKMFHWDKDPILQFNHNLSQTKYTASRYSLPEDAIQSLPKEVVKQNRIAMAYAHCSNWENEGQVRIGRVLEISDYLAELISYEFAGNNNHNPELSHFVTVCMDNFKLFNQMSAFEDLVIEAYPTYSGKTTIEIRIDALQAGQLKGTSRFLMASRKHNGKGDIMPPLEFTSEPFQESCHLRKHLGELHQIQRKQNQNLALDKFPPTEAESKEIHDVFLESLKSPNKYKHMKDSVLENNILLHVEDKNIHQNAFGGLIMKEGLDLALLSALRHCPGSTFPQIVHISDVLFIAPIQINQMVNFKSNVTYTHQQSNLVNVFVAVNTLSNLKGINKLTRATELHFTFFCDNQKEGVQQIAPQDYGEAMKFLESKRKLKTFLKLI